MTKYTREDFIREFGDKFYGAMIAIIMGSDSDLDVMEKGAIWLQERGIPFFMTSISAHRTPERMAIFAAFAHEFGFKVIIAGAGGAAHLPGMVASASSLPVIGVPIKSSNSIDGWDSILSILQMPNGIPVATVALNGGTNAAILATKIIALFVDKAANVISAHAPSLTLKCKKKQEIVENKMRTIQKQQKTA